MGDVQNPSSGLSKDSDPQTGQPVDEWDCSIAWMPMLQIEHSQMERQTGTSVRTLRCKNDASLN